MLVSTSFGGKLSSSAFCLPVGPPNLPGFDHQRLKKSPVLLVASLSLKKINNTVNRCQRTSINMTL